LANGSHSRKDESWRIIVNHWLDGDPPRGLHTPLKDWPREWLQGPNKIFAQKHFNRSVIALEFIETYNSNEAAFKATYPSHASGHTDLLLAINEARKARNDRVARK
jgi:hypothetical protein